MDESIILSMIDSMEAETKDIKEEIFRISWSMRGGVSSNDLFFLYSYEDRKLMGKIVKENIEATKKSGISLL